MFDRDVLSFVGMLNRSGRCLYWTALERLVHLFLRCFTPWIHNSIMTKTRIMNCIVELNPM
jgi:hypothetical protein